MAFGSKYPWTGKTDVRGPSPRRDGLGAALRDALETCDDLPGEFESRLSRIDAATRNRTAKRG
jgi:hypothetical protein